MVSSKSKIRLFERILDFNLILFSIKFLYTNWFMTFINNSAVLINLSASMFFTFTDVFLKFLKCFGFMC